MTDPATPVLEELDFLYTPSRDVAADTADLTAVLGGRLVFAIEDSGIRVAMIELAGAPRILLTDHLHGDRPILVYRVADLDAAVAALGRPNARSRSRTDRAARSGRPAGTGSPSTNWCVLRSPAISRAAATSEPTPPASGALSPGWSRL